jgi:hypothetical protein
VHDFPNFDQLTLADRLRIVALVADGGDFRRSFLDTLPEAADRLDDWEWTNQQTESRGRC